MAQEIHIGDYKTEYIFPVYDKGVNFDPSGATTKELHFRNPGVSARQDRAATVAQRTINGVAGVWCLVYQVTQADVTNNLFHVKTGKVKIQAVLIYPDGKWSSNQVTTDQDGEEIRVYSNLA